MYIRMKDEMLHKVAGLFSGRKNEKGEKFLDYTFITTELNKKAYCQRASMIYTITLSHFETGSEWIRDTF